MALTLFGFEIGRANKQTSQDQDIKNKTFSIPENTDGAVTIQSGSYYGTYVDLDGVVRNEIELITRYREMSMQPELETAIDDIVNESIINDNNGKGVELNLDDLNQPDTIKKRINEEFEFILKLLDFGNMGHDIYRRWYIDGRLFYHVVINDKSPSKGIEELRYIDPRRIRKIREIQKTKDSRTGMELIKRQSEYYLYNERGVIGAHSNLGAKIAVDAVVNVNSGLMDGKRAMVLSYLHKAIKPLNQLRMVEDATVIYRLSRAPERRVFYVDVGNMSTIKAEQYLRDTMVKYRNKLVYDSSTGEIKDDRKHLSMLEDFWLPRREGCFSLDTKIKLLDGRDVELGQLIVEHKLGKINWVYSISPEGTIVPGKISWAGVTRADTEVMDIHLDNGEIITSTPDHKFILRNGVKIEAKDLMIGSSLMPLYTRKENISTSGKYLQVLDNDTNSWKFVHRMVAESILGERVKTDVVHHIDFTHDNNNPDNLVYMNKKEHFLYHSLMGTNSWNNGNREEHCLNLSISGKQYFNTDAGMKRRIEISEHNRECEAVWQGLARGRETIVKNRNIDREHLSNEEYLKKWSPGLSSIDVKAAAKKAGAIRKLDVKTLSKEDFNKKYGIGKFYNTKISKISLPKIIEIIKTSVKDDINISNSELIFKIKEHYPDMNLKKIRTFLMHHGYDSISDLIYRCTGANFISKKRAVQIESIANHQVTKIVFRSDKLDVGTLTIDETHEHHDYHNFALSSGIFVMNSKGTEITTLPGAMNLGELEDVKYFEKKLYRALGVPVSRLESSTGFSLGRTTEITRDELKFNKFVQRLRNKFSTLFDDLLRVQLLLKKVCTEEEWKTFKENIWYDYKKDNNFTELKEAELITTRIQTLQLVDPYVGRYYSAEWVRKNILQQTDEDIEELDAQMANEAAAAQPTDANGNPAQLDANGQPVQSQVPANAPPPTPGQDIQQTQQQPQVQQEDGSTKEQEDPLIDKKKMRFINDTMEIA